jgi:hypothetical protein
MAQSKPAHRAAPKPETPHLRFVQEFVRELIEMEDLTKTSEKELAEDKTLNEKFSSGIYVSKSVQLELRSEISMLKGMRLNDPFDTLIPTLIACYQRQIALHEQLIGISKKFLAGPAEGVDYQALAGKVPEIRAELDETRKIILDGAAPIFMSLIDMRPDSKGHASHLIITKAEKADLEDRLNILLKDEPDKGDHDYYISAAMILKAGLNKGYKCADEPWE